MLKREVSGDVAESIVDGFEIIEINHQTRERAIVAARFGVLARQDVLQSVAIEETCERIRHGALLRNVGARGRFFGARAQLIALAF